MIISSDNNNDQKLETVLRDYAIKALSRREHSSLELLQKLKVKALKYNSKQQEDEQYSFETNQLIQSYQHKVIVKIIDDLKKSDILSNDRFGESYEKKLRSRGRSGFYIKQQMRSKGIDWQDLEQEENDLKAAKRFLKRRKHVYIKDQSLALKALTRQGFSYNLAKQAINETNFD